MIDARGDWSEHIPKPALDLQQTPGPRLVVPDDHDGISDEFPEELSTYIQDGRQRWKLIAGR